MLDRVESRLYNDTIDRSTTSAISGIGWLVRFPYNGEPSDARLIAGAEKPFGMGI